jgi:hypothetical protein
LSIQQARLAERQRFPLHLHTAAALVSGTHLNMQMAGVVAGF